MLGKNTLKPMAAMSPFEFESPRKVSLVLSTLALDCSSCLVCRDHEWLTWPAVILATYY